MSRGIARREFVARVLAAGLSLPAISALLSGCRPRPDAAAVSGSGPLERELAIYNWSDYIGETTLADFER